MEQLKPSAANSSPLTPLGFLDRAATVYGDTPSVIYDGVTFTWSDTRRRCLQLASALSSLGIRRGDVVSVVAPNIPAMYELHFAVPFAGAILNNINTRLDARTISVILRHAESKLVFVDTASRDVVLEALSLFPENPRRPILIFIADDAVERLTPSSTVHFKDSYEGLISKGDPNFKWLYPNSEWDPMILNYTSGTTSSPKGVVHCHRGTFVMTVDSLIDWAVPKQPVYLWTLPMFHANGWSFPWGMAAVGGTNICVRKFDARIVFSLITRHRVTHMCGAPVVLNMLTNAPDNKPLENPVHILTAGAPPPSAVLHRTESLGFIVSHGYGLTETGGLVVSCAWKRKWNHFPAAERARLKSRQGVRTCLLTEMDVVTPAGESVKRDGVTLGEVVMRGSCVMLGYLKDPEGTRKCFKNGYFYTGDVGVMHEDGYLEIKDRSKDVIISGGENLSSVEVESVLYMHPAVNEAAVVARPDEYWGETPCAFVSVKEGKAVTEKEIIEHCRKNMPKYMVPKTVAFREELPKTSTGKIQKFVLRQIAQEMGPIRHSKM
ncbi:2-methylpropanoate--CoA ligase CCL4 [Arachis duranensis]|uniref:2-methylpropanoate--CoA ligase CCL4 n=1 Tax=Arachis duranensis TaxID=130453 RepID=A0A6P4B048_ARADU|nr:2-methylpropanoate--CoA ligase CCL4 [Arachis duranensis]XP_057725378.1 2-methylpropanoate--CoA ligase CCL4-like [Arachis stenosperma]